MSQKVTIERTLQVGTPSKQAEPELPDVFTQPGEFFRQAFNIGLAIAVVLGVVIVACSVVLGLITFIAAA